MLPWCWKANDVPSFVERRGQLSRRQCPLWKHGLYSARIIDCHQTWGYQLNWMDNQDSKVVKQRVRSGMFFFYHKTRIPQRIRLSTAGSCLALKVGRSPRPDPILQWIAGEFVGGVFSPIWTVLSFMASHFCAPAATPNQCFYAFSLSTHSESLSQEPK